MLYLVAVATTLALFDDVAAFGQIADDGVRAALGDTQFSGDVAQPHVGIMGDAQESSAVVAEKGPSKHGKNVTRISLEKDC